MKSVAMMITCQSEPPYLGLVGIPMQDAIRISLRYKGPEVDSGEMDIGEVVSALQGFASAYGKTASFVSPSAQHELKVTAIKEGSFELLIAAAVFIHSGGFDAIKSVAEAAKFTFGLITDVIKIKKHVKNEPYSVTVNGDDNLILIGNGEGSKVSFSVDAFKLFKEKAIDQELSKITAPLRAGEIVSAELKEDNDQSHTVIVDSSEREYFRPASVSRLEEKEVIGTLISLNKENHRGTFKFGNGNKARYAFVGEDKEGFHQDFAHKGPVKAIADVEFDENLLPIHLDIKSVQPMQLNLLPEEANGE